ncbi:hypothetical protein HYFRA_00007664 [Hymenoscyphus fraxineus]|uniref:Uncharacterized protein n=1 Tax=Hymenoscyphus fraxineus TaxID=746836 RepID=A0A9N9KS84_9HELO|nr:hypothetical protein HYFRA_00007664 [Hymenoscyphus fraxineus]
MEIRTENRGRIGAPNTGAMPAYHDDGSKQTSSIMGPFKAPEIYRESHEDINPFNKGVAFKRVQRRQIKPPSLLNWNHRESFKAFATQLPTVTPRPSCLDLASCNLSTKRSPQASFERKRDKKVVYRWGMQFCIDSEATLQHYIEMGQTGVIIVKPKNRLMNCTDIDITKKLQKGSKEKAPQIIKETLSLLNRSPIPPADFSAPLFFDRPRRLKDRVKTSYVKFGNRSNTFGPGDYATKY